MRVGLAIELLRQELELAADRLIAAEQLLRRRNMGTADDRAPPEYRPWRRAARPPDAAARDRASSTGLGQAGDLLGEPRGDRLRRRAGACLPRARRGSRSRASCLLDDAFEPLAFGPARAATSCIECGAKSREQSLAERRLRLLALLPLRPPRPRRAWQAACRGAPASSRVSACARSATASACPNAASFRRISSLSGLPLDRESDACSCRGQASPGKGCGP